MDEMVDDLSKQLKKYESNNFSNHKNTNKNIPKVSNINELMLQNIKLSHLNEVYLNKINDLSEKSKEKHI